MPWRESGQGTSPTGASGSSSSGLERQWLFVAAHFLIRPASIDRSARQQCEPDEISRLTLASPTLSGFLDLSGDLASIASDESGGGRGRRAGESLGTGADLASSGGGRGKRAGDGTGCGRTLAGDASRAGRGSGRGEAAAVSDGWRSVGAEMVCPSRLAALTASAARGTCVEVEADGGGTTSAEAMMRCVDNGIGGGAAAATRGAATGAPSGRRTPPILD